MECVEGEIMTETPAIEAKPNGFIFCDGKRIDCPKCRDNKIFMSRRGVIEPCRECY